LPFQLSLYSKSRYRHFPAQQFHQPGNEGKEE